MDKEKDERRTVCLDNVGPIDIILLDAGEEHRFKSYWALMDYTMHQSLDICVNSPEEYEALDAEERKKLDAVHAAWFPNP